MKAPKKPGTYWAKGPDGWLFFEVSLWTGERTAWSVGWHGEEPVSDLLRSYTEWRRARPPKR